MKGAVNSRAKTSSSFIQLLIIITLKNALQPWKTKDNCNAEGSGNLLIEIVNNTELSELHVC